MTILATLLGCGATPPAEPVVPTDDAALLAFVTSGAYASWPAEPQKHPSRGPHPGDARVFLAPGVAARAPGSGPHAPGAAAVLELYDDQGAVGGWAVMVKVAPGSEPESWFYWKHYAGETVKQGAGVDPCAACHQKGDDFVLTSLAANP